MLVALTRGTLFNVAIWIAALAVFAFAAPPIAVAFAPTEYVVHCLTHDDHGMGMADQDQAVDHHHPGDLDHEKHGSGGDHKANCCGLFCVTALPASSGHTFEHAWAGHASFLCVADQLFWSDTRQTRPTSNFSPVVLEPA
jgi:hypothetical protein